MQTHPLISQPPNQPTLQTSITHNPKPPTPNNSNTIIQKFQKFNYKGIHSPVNKFSVGFGDTVLQTTHENQHKYQEKYIKYAIPTILPHYGKQNNKQPNNSQEGNTTIRGSRAQGSSTTASNHTHSHIYTYVRATGSPLTFEIKHRRNCSEVLASGKPIDAALQGKNIDNGVNKTRDNPSQLPSYKQNHQSYQPNMHKKLSIDNQQQLMTQIQTTQPNYLSMNINEYPPKGENHRNRKVVSRSHSGNGKQQYSTINHSGKYTHAQPYKSANKVSSRQSNTSTIRAQNTIYKPHPKHPNFPTTTTNPTSTTTTTKTIPYTSPSKSQTPQPLTSTSIINYLLSPDGNYRIISRTLEGQELKQAVEFQRQANIKAKKVLHIQKDKEGENGNSSTIQGQQQYVVEPSKMSNKENGIIRAFAVNSHQGILRKYNQDRASIILNVNKNGIKTSYFAIYDGHGGSNCCNYLTQNLHHFIFNSKKFPNNPRKAIIEGLKLAESTFIEKVKNTYNQMKLLDRSGSCVLIALFVQNQCYIVNIGDSRAILSTCQGKPIYSLSRDHKPTELGEQNRIFREGGKIYRTEMMKVGKDGHGGDSGSCSGNSEHDQKQSRKNGISSTECYIGNEQNNKNNNSDTNELLLRNSNSSKQTKPTQQQNQLIIGPLRVFPGKLSVSRTLGDIEAKQPQFGGINNCISSDPQICKYDLSGKEDFILLGCDGVFERLESEDVAEEAWKVIRRNGGKSIHEAVGAAAQAIVRLCMERKSADNLTVVIIWLGDVGRGTGQSAM